VSSARPSPSTVTVPGPGRYRVDVTRTTIAVATKHIFGLGNVRATFALTGAEIVLAERVEESRVEASAAAASFTSANSGRDKRVSSKAFLNVDANPEITFTSRAVVRTGDSWTVPGALTVRGVSADLELTVTDLHEVPGGLALVATGSIDRYAHGITGAKGLAGRYLEVTISAVASIA
jgi:polyisoprenoid-binding protein YceI